MNTEPMFIYIGLLIASCGFTLVVMGTAMFISGMFNIPMVK